MRLTSFLIATLVLSIYSSTAQGLPITILKELDAEVSPATLSETGAVAYAIDFGGTQNNTLLGLLANGAGPVEGFPVNPNERLYLIGFASTGEIVVLAQSDNYDLTLRYYDPQTFAKREILIGTNIYFPPEVAMINQNNLVVLKLDTELVFIDSNFHVTHLPSDVEYDTNYGLSYLSSLDTFLIQDYKRGFFTASPNQPLSKITDNIFNITRPSSFYTSGPSDYVAAGVVSSKGNKIGYHLYNLVTKEKSEIKPINLSSQNLPSFEAGLYTARNHIYPDGRLLEEIASTGYSDTDYVGSSIVEINKNGTINDLNCYIAPSVGYLTEILAVNKKGNVLANLAAPNRKRYLVLISSLDSGREVNYCLKIKASVEKKCRTSFDFPSGGLGKKGYMNAINFIPDKRSCLLSLTVKDMNGLPVRNSKIVLRKEGATITSAVRTNRKGNASINLAPVRANRDACGWSVKVEDGKHQRNGVVIFREQSGDCRRI